MPHLLLVALFFVGLLAAAFSLGRIALDVRRNTQEDRALTDDLILKGALYNDVRLYVLLCVQARDLFLTRSGVIRRADELWRGFTDEQREVALRQLVTVEVETGRGVR